MNAAEAAAPAAAAELAPGTSVRLTVPGERTPVP